jgi:hypothetical protein
MGQPRRSDPCRPHFLFRQLRASTEPSGLITISPANVAAINAACGHQLSGADCDGLSKSRPQQQFSGKDHQFSRNDQFSVRYSLYDVHSNNSRGAEG